ncbi:uncharacterized protein PITG_00040 [Phytophthora infestans T30-4]|uniref:Uncharacterized protein n=1 Tax=Phytophthora infestans (strain T30-4) TaxID=403677 RepID=D0MSQ5_PHYIT|nr:uncharacterized protein PITG_00040 [Phytophthora infestans T30-4]EEY57489.1 hypothetical protein PITG_00040 [Phytophthora infestans T30-4]|eukprot:XP_002908675.1 hypothetical protein PITG_00040 [Phytophthora infestans T30-4]
MKQQEMNVQIGLEKFSGRQMEYATWKDRIPTHVAKMVLDVENELFEKDFSDPTLRGPSHKTGRDFTSSDVEAVKMRFPRSIPASVVVALESGTQLRVYAGCYTVAREERSRLVDIPIGYCIVFRGDLLHAGQLQNAKGTYSCDLCQKSFAVKTLFSSVAAYGVRPAYPHDRAGRYGSKNAEVCRESPHRNYANNTSVSLPRSSPYATYTPLKQCQRQQQLWKLQPGDDVLHEPGRHERARGCGVSFVPCERFSRGQSGAVCSLHGYQFS